MESVSAQDRITHARKEVDSVQADLTAARAAHAGVAPDDEVRLAKLPAAVEQAVERLKALDPVLEGLNR